jgi:hypothetical protein
MELVKSNGFRIQRMEFWNKVSFSKVNREPQEFPNLCLL